MNGLGRSSIALFETFVGPSEGDNPEQKVRTTLASPGGDGSFDAEGYLAVDGSERRMEWGAEAGRDYSGWLAVSGSGDGASEVTVHLSFGERSVEGHLERQAPEGEDPLTRGIAETLESIRRQIEEGSGKVEPSPPPPGAEPPTEENPAVVRDDPPPPPGADGPARATSSRLRPTAGPPLPAQRAWAPIR